MAKETESTINNFQKQKAPGLDGFCDEFHIRFNDNITLMFYKLFQKLEAEEILPNSFYEAQHYLKDIERRTRQT